MNQSVLSQVRVTAPESRPRVWLPQLQLGVTGDEAAGKRVVPKSIAFGQVSAFGIACDVLDDVFKGGSFAFFFSQDMVISLALERGSQLLQNGFELLA